MPPHRLAVLEVEDGGHESMAIQPGEKPVGLVEGEVEAEVLRRLSEIGLVVPTRNASRHHTKTEERCWKVGVTGFGGKGGRAFTGRHPCHGGGCNACAHSWADRQMSGIRRAHPDFVALDHVYRETLLSYTAKSDKVPEGYLWVTSVVMPSDTSGTLKDRLKTRARRLFEPATVMVIPCDGLAVVVSTADLAPNPGGGRPLDTPTSGAWLPISVAFVYLKAVLASTAVCGRLDWPKLWKPEEPMAKKAYTISGPPLITTTAWRILTSEGYEWGPSGSSWLRDDPMDVLLDAKRRAEKFWAEPACSICRTQIGPKDKHWWRDGHPRCGPCDLVVDLASYMTCGRTEREIEGHLRLRKLTFRRHRAFIEQALSRLGAIQAKNGIWVPRGAGEEAM